MKGLPSASRATKSGFNLSHLLGHETELWRRLGIEFLLVAKRHRLKRENRFARFVHRLDRLLEPHRGSSDTQLPIGSDADCYGYAMTKRRLPNACDKCRRLGSSGSDADDPGLPATPALPMSILSLPVVRSIPAA